jgi:DNA-binding GntR family transcriptional regulator
MKLKTGEWMVVFGESQTSVRAKLNRMKEQGLAEYDPKRSWSVNKGAMSEDQWAKACELQRKLQDAAAKRHEIKRRKDADQKKAKRRNK